MAIGDTWVLKLPWTSPPLTLNQRLHYRPKAALTAELRDAAFKLAKFHKVDRGCERIRITLVYRPKDGRHRDAINLTPTLKALEDGIVDAKVVPDDTPVYIDPVMPVIVSAERGKPGLLVVRIDRLA